MTPLITEPMAVFGYLAAVFAAIFWISELPALQKLFRITPAVIYCYFIPTLSTTVGIIPMSSPVYDWMTRYLLPVALLDALDAGPGELGTLLADTRIGTAILVQAAALVAAGAAAAALARSGASRAPGAGAVWGAALASAPAVGLVAISWSGHAGSGNDPSLGIAIDAVHTLGSAAWLGGLAALIALVPSAAARMRDPERMRLAAGIVVRFSALAVAAVALVTLSGVYRALVELGSLDDLLDTAYGRALAVKLGLFALLLVGGAVNRFVMHPRLERAALGLADDDRGALGTLRVSVAAELLLAAALMVSVAVLVSLPPPA